MDLQNKDRVALVAAATSEVSFTLARALAAEGAQVVLTGRAEAGLHETVVDIRREGRRAFGIATDLNRPSGPPVLPIFVVLDALDRSVHACQS